MAYLHTDIFSRQSSKKDGDACGDYFAYQRDDDSITMVLSDGLGSGIKANISAHLCVNRLLALLKNGASLNKAFSILCKSMNKLWGKGYPFAVFTVARILNNGDATVLSYESPPPIIIGDDFASVLSNRVFTVGKAIIYESNYKLQKDEGLLLLSDGITQAGIGKVFSYGWEIERVRNFIMNLKTQFKIENESIAELVHDKAKEYWGRDAGDDCTAVYAQCRNGVVLNVLSGPPADTKMDAEFVNDFIKKEGIKIVCGGTSSKVVARELNRKLTVEEDSGNSLSPPNFKIDGINLVTEGVVTLNQVYNLLDEDTSDLISESSVYELNDFILNADKINFWIGTASNPGIENIQFIQQGIIARNKIIPLIAEKLKQKGKLVVVKEY